MEISERSIYTTRQSRTMVLIIILLLGAFLIFCSLHILTALFSAAIFYILFKPLYINLTAKRHMRRGFAGFTVILISFLVVVLPLIGLCFMIFNKVSDFQKHPELLQAFIPKMQHLAGPHFDIKATLDKSINEISKWAMGLVSVVLGGALTIFIDLVVLYSTLFFMLRSHETFEKTLIKHLPFDRKSLLKFGVELKKITYSNILGQGLISLAQGIIVGVGFLIFKIPDPLFWGIVAIFVCFIPVVGAPVILIPASLIELSEGHIVSGVGILIWGIVLVTIVDNFLRQFISKKVADTHPLITIIGVLIGMPLFGIIGLVIGPFLISFFFLLFKIYEQNYLSGNSTEELLEGK